MTVTQRPGPRLPAAPQQGGRGGEIVRGIAAFVAVVLLVVGVPCALWAAFGAPWPSSMPGASWFTQPLTTEVLLHVLAAVVWLAWLHFVACVVVEAVSEVRHRGLAPRVPGGGIGTQALARKLVATVLLLVGTASLVAPAASATQATAPEHRQAGVERIVSQAAQSAAETTKVSNAQRPATAELARATRADQRSDDATVYYDVKPPNNRNYDTLWDIAERYLGDGLRYKEIYAMNRDAVQPDGRTLTNPDLIHPGWVMKMPSDARGPGLKVVEDARDAAPVAPSSGDPAAGGSATADEGSDAAASAGGASAGEAGGGVGGTIDLESASSMKLGEWAPVMGAAGGLALAGALIGLRRRRASSPRGGGGGDRTKSAVPSSVSPVDLSARVEAGLRQEAAPADARWLAGAVQGLRALALPPLSRGAVSSDGVVLSFRTPTDAPLPQGWSSDDGRTWTLSRENVHPLTTAAGPLPGLVCVGTRPDGAILMLDLESYDGVVSIGGDPVVARALAMSVAVETATHPWPSGPVVTLVGFADDVTSLGNVRAVTDIARALDALDNVAHEHRTQCRALGVDSIEQARRLGDGGEAPSLQLVVCSGVPDAAALSRLRAWATDPMVSVAVVVVGDFPDGAARLTATEDGRLQSRTLGVDVAAQQLAPEICRGLSALFSLPDDLDAVDLGQLAESLVTEEAVLATGDDEPVVVSVDVLGTVAVRAPGQVEDARRELLEEIVTYLALHPDGVHINVLTGAIWPRGVEPATRDATLDAVAQWLGDDPTGQSVLQETAGVWAIRRQSLALDWDRFRAALNRAVTSRSRIPALRTAMSLVRGSAFDGLPQGRYAWLAHLDVESDIALAIELTSSALAADCSAADDPSGARDALLAGLAALPADETLWSEAMRLAIRFSGRADAAVVADQMYAAVAAHGSPLGVSARTEALVEELLPGYRRGVA